MGNLLARRGPAIARDLRVNQMIRIPQVRVVDEEGAQLGVMPTPQALAMAQERGLDLVEVAPMAAPPVVKFLDFGQYKYELTKREKENKRRQRSVTFKEVRLSPKIGTGDFETKVHRAVEFLEDGDRIKVTVRFRGRELTHPELGRNMLQRFTERIKDHGVAERAPLLEGKSMHLTVASLHKPKEHEVAKPKGREAEDGGEAAATEPDTAPGQPAPAGPAASAAPAPAEAPAKAPASAEAPAPAKAPAKAPASAEAPAEAPAPAKARAAAPQPVAATAAPGAATRTTESPASATATAAAPATATGPAASPAPTGE
ncbi:MAG TPA: translation initiation factor IF-3 [Candidatus Limnocylindrales bacterium]|nr:translation initiation factor IF-3 [Candidatus Limnocylindrales bacterium]